MARPASPGVGGKPSDANVPLEPRVYHATLPVLQPRSCLNAKPAHLPKLTRQATCFAGASS